MLDKAYTGHRNKYGYGWEIDTFNDKKTVSHGGDIWGFHSEFLRIPEDDVCIILLSNVEDTGLKLIARKILAILYNQPDRLPAKNEIILDTGSLREYAGDYEMQPGMIIKIVAEGKRLIGITDRKVELYALKKDVFVIEAGENQFEVTFERDSQGTIIALSFDKGGKKLVSKKIR